MILPSLGLAAGLTLALTGAAEAQTMTAPGDAGSAPPLGTVTGSGRTPSPAVESLAPDASTARAPVGGAGSASGTPSGAGVGTGVGGPPGTGGIPGTGGTSGGPGGIGH